MRRRHFIAATGTIGTGSLTGCLGSGQDDGTEPNGQADDDTPDDEASENGDSPLDGRSQWRYDAGHSGYAAGITGPTEKPELQRIYQGVGMAPLTADGALYTETWSAWIAGDVRWQIGEPHLATNAQALYKDNVLGHGGPFDGFWAVSMDEGSKQWQTDLSADPHSPPVPGGTPTTVQGDRAFFSTSPGVGCVDLAEQEEAWQTDLAGEVPYYLRGGWLPPVATPEHVYALSEAWDPDRDYEKHPRQMYALDSETGELDWTAELELGEAGFGYLPPITDEEYLYVTAEVNENPDAKPESDHGDWLRVVAVDPNDREVAWTKTLEGGYGPGTLSAVANDRLFVIHGGVTSEDAGDGAARDPLYSALSTDDGSVLWTVDHEYVVAHPTVTDDFLYVVDGSLRALEPATGEERWSIDLQDHAELPDPTEVNLNLPSTPVVYDGRIFVYLNQVGLVEFQ